MVLASRTHQQLPVGRPSRPRAAPWTDETVRPTQLQQIIPTRLLGPESGLQFGQASGVVFHTQYHNILGLLESNKYPVSDNCGLGIWCRRRLVLPGEGAVILW